MPRIRVIAMMTLVMISVTTLDACRKKPETTVTPAGPDSTAIRLAREAQCE